MTDPAASEKATDEADREAEIDDVLAEFDGDARAAIRALLDDQATLIDDAQQAVSRGFLRASFRMARVGRRSTMNREEPARSGTPLVAYPWVIVRLRCHVCPRHADVRLAALAARYGHRVPVRTVLHAFMGGCPWDPYSAWRSKPQKYGHRCGAYLPDLNSTRPPDLPPAMGGLSLIEGGKDDMLPAEPERIVRRRVGGSDDD